MKWICFTGIDGAGKTGMVNYTYELLSSRTKVKKMKIPYYDWVREMIKISGEGTIYGDPHTDSLIFSASNRLELYEIAAISREYEYLVSQRSWIDNFPYRAAQGISFVEAMHILKPEKFRVPDIIFYLDCKYDIAYNRIKNEKGDKYENLSFMSRLEKEFTELFNDSKKQKLLGLNKSIIIRVCTTGEYDYVKNEVKKNLSMLNII